MDALTKTPATASRHETLNVPIGLGEAILLRTIMKNHASIREAVLDTLKKQVVALGVVINENAWEHLVLANAAELELSRAHVIE
jgi:hypothetical protein